MFEFTEQLQEELKKFVAQQLQLVPNFSDELESATDYIVLLIANGRSAEETWKEVDELFSNESLKEVINKTYQALQDYRNQAAAAAAATGAATAVSSSQSEPAQTSSSSQPSELPLSSEQSQSQEVNMDAGTFQQRPLNSRASNTFGRGISKNLPSGPRNSALKNAGAFQRAMDLSNGANGMGRKKSRCHKFPNCPNAKDCMFAHPTRPCFNFPNCPNAPGTCNYLHPGEDDELMAELAKSKQEYREKKAQIQLKQNQAASGITLCKFGAVCTNPQCPFGHPTVANEDMKVTRLEWCALNLKCEDSECPKAHSSGSKVREVVKPVIAVAAASQPFVNTSSNQPPAEKTLEQCKFGKFCTNRHCRYRHAKSTVMCREGENCQRIDCFFSHPIAEDCRFGEGCTNPKCAFRHPNGKMDIAVNTTGVQNLTWTAPTANTDARQFAVPEEQVLERIVKQEDGSIKQEPLI